MKLIQLLKELEINKPLPNFPSDVRWYCIIKDKDTLVRILDYLGKKKWRWAGRTNNTSTFTNDPEYMGWIIYNLEEHKIIYLFGNFSRLYWRGKLDIKSDLSQFKQIKL